jgi:hypothetical protein
MSRRRNIAAHQIAAAVKWRGEPGRRVLFQNG